MNIPVFCLLGRLAVGLLVIALSPNDSQTRQKGTGTLENRDSAQEVKDVADDSFDPAQST